MSIESLPPWPKYPFCDRGSCCSQEYADLIAALRARLALALETLDELMEIAKIGEQLLPLGVDRFQASIDSLKKPSP